MVRSETEFEIRNRSFVMRLRRHQPFSLTSDPTVKQSGCVIFRERSDPDVQRFQFPQVCELTIKLCQLQAALVQPGARFVVVRRRSESDGVAECELERCLCPTSVAGKLDRPCLETFGEKDSDTIVQGEQLG